MYDCFAREVSRVRASCTVPRLQVRPLVSHNEDLNSLNSPLSPPPPSPSPSLGAGAGAADEAMAAAVAAAAAAVALPWVDPASSWRELSAPAAASRDASPGVLIYGSPAKYTQQKQDTSRSQQTQGCAGLRQPQMSVCRSLESICFGAGVVLSCGATATSCPLVRNSFAVCFATHLLRDACFETLASRHLHPTLA